MIKITLKVGEMTETQSFGQWLRHRRRELDLTQTKLGQAVGCSQITIRKIEADDLRPSRQLSELLVDKLGVSPEKREAHIHFARSGFYPVSVSTAPACGNLPHWLTSFIGRDQEVEEVKQILRTSRLVTLTGSGGSGKTRLSVQIAARVRENYPDGIWFIELASITDPEIVPQTVAAALGMQRGGDISYTSILTNFLQAQRAMLILDNCEHVLDACIDLVDMIIQRCPQTTILATSRETLGIIGEKTYRVPSLPAFDPEEISDHHTLEHSDSVRLFADRAAAILPGFTLTSQNLLPITRICYRLDGIPLAIELAAARMSMLSVDEIAERLDDRFKLLTNGSRSALPRQRTLRASIDWSYSLLSGSERLLLQRQAMFSGSWTYEAAGEVCAGDGLNQDEILEALASLVSKSLVEVDNLSGRNSRYSMLETIRQYALQKLEEEGESANLRDKHLDYYLTIATKYGPLLKTSQVKETLDLLDPELDNLRAALSWALEKDCPEGSEKALVILCALHYFWAIRALYWETFPRFLNAFKRLNNDKKGSLELRAWGLYILAAIQSDFNIEKESIGYLNQCIVLFRQIGNNQGLALALALRSYLNFRQHAFFPPDSPLTIKEAQRDQEESIALSNTFSQSPGGKYHSVIAWVDCWNGAGEVFRPDPAKARALGLKVQEAFQKLGDTIGEQYGLLEWLIASILLGDAVKLESHINHAIELAERINHKRYLSFFINQKVTVFGLLEHYHKMETYALQGLMLQRQLGSPLGEVENYQFLGLANIYLQNYSQALTFLRAGLRVSTQVMNSKDPYNLIIIITLFAGLASYSHQYKRASILLGFVEEQLDFFSKELDGLEKQAFIHFEKQAQGALSESEFQSFWQQGRAMTMEQAVTLVQEDWEI